jgi:hypothetical protein
MWPDKWNAEKIVEAADYACKRKIINPENPDGYIGLTKEGIKVQFYKNLDESYNFFSSHSMSKYVVSTICNKVNKSPFPIVEEIDGKRFILGDHDDVKPFPIIKEKNGKRVFRYISLMLNSCRDDFSLDRIIAEIKLYPNNAGFRDGQDGEELDLIDDQIIRVHNGNPEILEFFNDNIEDLPIEIISKQDFINILEQWKKILSENKT